MQHARTAITLSAICLFAACGDAHDAQFGEETELERELLVAVAQGDLVVAAVFVAAFTADDSTTASCPARSQSGSAVTLSGGCTDSDGDRFDGSIRLANFEPYDPSQDAVVEYDRFVVTNGDGDVVNIDGRVTLSDEASSRIDADLSWGIDSVEETWRAEISASLTCADDFDDCTYDANSSGALDSIGGFAIDGRYGEGGQVTLSGSNQMQIDFAQDCATVRVGNDAPTEVCP